MWWTWLSLSSRRDITRVWMPPSKLLLKFNFPCDGIGGMVAGGSPSRGDEWPEQYLMYRSAWLLRTALLLLGTALLQSWTLTQRFSFCFLQCSEARWHPPLLWHSKKAPVKHRAIILDIHSPESWAKWSFVVMIYPVCRILSRGQEAYWGSGCYNSDIVQVDWVDLCPSSSIMISWSGRHLCAFPLGEVWHTSFWGQTLSSSLPRTPTSVCLSTTYKYGFPRSPQQTARINCLI